VLEQFGSGKKYFEFAKEAWGKYAGAKKIFGDLISMFYFFS
jgi:hypothetical protein